MKKQDNVNLKLNSQQNIIIRNLLRSLGLNPNHKGSILIIKAVQLVSSSDDEFVIIDNIYKDLTKYYVNLNIQQIKMTIKYALDHRIEEKTIKNFEKIFGFEYDEYIFTNKNFIEELSRVININVS